MKINVGIYGASGYAGLELIKILESHPQMDVIHAASNSFAGESYRGVRFIPVESLNPATVDLVFLCTPHGASAPLAEQALDAGARAVDLSADLRLKTTEQYTQWYHAEHPAPHLLPTEYGLPEFNRDNIKNQDCIANPGCYPTTTLLGLLPLAQAEGIRAGAALVVDAKSGVSGAGRKPKLGTHFVEVFGDFKPYNIGRVHRHVGEIEQELKAVNPTLGSLIFSPHLLPIDRGLLATCYVPLVDGWTLDTVRQCLEDTYKDEPLITVLQDGQTATIKDVARTYGAVLSVHPATDDTVIVVSALDNLLKGASSQAIQNANLMFNLPETMGLL